MPSSHLILCRRLLLLSPIPPIIRVFSSESTLRMRWPTYWSFSFSFSSSNEYSGLISFSLDWLDLLAVQGTLKSLLQYHSSKASIFQHSAFFTVQLSHLYMITGKIIALTRQRFVGKVMSLLFNMLSRLVINFLPRNKHLLISWLQSDFGAQKSKVWHCFHCLPINCLPYDRKKRKCYSLSRVRLFVTPWTVDCQASLSEEFSRQEYWSGLPFPSPGDCPNPGIEQSLPHCRQSLTALKYFYLL